MIFDDRKQAGRLLAEHLGRFAAEQRDNRAQKLRDAAAVGGRVEMQHPSTLQARGAALDLIQGGVGRDAPIGAQRELADVDRLQHCYLSIPSPLQRSRIRHSVGIRGKVGAPGHLSASTQRLHISL